MSPEEIESTIREYIGQVIHMSLATSKDNKPWVCEVHFAYDDDLNLYFVSSKNTRHAKEIEANPYVAGNIITQHHKHQKVRGVYFEGHAERLEDITADNKGYTAYVDRLGGWGGMLNEISKDGAAAMYKITVDNYYIFDGYGEKREKYQLPWSEKQ